MADRSEIQQGVGYMQIIVSSGNGAIPLKDATVRVYEYNPETNASNGSLVKTLKTDRQGRTELLSLPAPPRQTSLYPNNSKGYSTYNIEAYLDGYYPQQYINVPIFDGVTAIQNIRLVPIAENGRESYTYETRFFETENQFLE